MARDPSAQRRLRRLGPVLRWRGPVAIIIATLSVTQGALAMQGARAHRRAQTAPTADATRGLASVTGSRHVRVLHLREPGNGRTHSVWVYRPNVPGGASLPVVYLLHGVPGQASDPFTAGLARSLDSYIAAGGTPFIVASPDGDDPREDTEWADSADGTQHLESFLVNVVIRAVEGSHRRSARLRAIAGFSMGGYGAANIALHHPDLFGQLVSIAGYFHVDDPDHVFTNRRSIAANSPDEHVAAVRTLRILLLDAADEDIPVIRGESARFKRLLDAAGIPATLQISPGEHNWAYVASRFPTLERFLTAGWPVPR